jgi:hypothetical protein
MKSTLQPTNQSRPVRAAFERVAVFVAAAGAVGELVEISAVQASIGHPCITLLCHNTNHLLLLWLL